MSAEYAVYTDCRRLIYNFAINLNPSFEFFCFQWRTMNFQHMYAIQTSTVELMQTTSTILHVAKRIACGHQNDGMPKNDDEHVKRMRQIGAFYLMYAIYFKQTTVGYCKIEVSLETWKEMQNFIENLPNEEMYDEVRYVFNELVKSNAFRFCALDYKVGIDKLVDYDKVDEKHETEQNFNMNAKKEEESYKQLKQHFPQLEELQSKLAEYNQLEKEYNEQKCKLIENKVDGLDAQSLPMSEIFQNINKVFENIDKILQPNKNNEKESENATNSKRRQLKNKAFRSKTKKNYNESTDEDEMDHDTENDSSSNAENDADDKKQSSRKSKNKYVVKRMSSKTIFAQELPAEVLNELRDDDDDDEMNEEEDANDSEADEIDDVENNLQDDSQQASNILEWKNDFIYTDDDDLSEDLDDQPSSSKKAKQNLEKSQKAELSNNINSTNGSDEYSEEQLDKDLATILS